MAYTSALAVGAALAGHLGSLAASPAAARELLEHATGLTDAAPVAGHLAERRVVLCVGAQADQTTARELALKIAEGARLPTLALELETVLHGQLAAHDPADALILVAITDHPDRERIVRRATHVARAAGTIGLPVAGLLSDTYDQALATDLTPAGRFVTKLADPDALDRRLAGLLAGRARCSSSRCAGRRTPRQPRSHPPGAGPVPLRRPRGRELARLVTAVHTRRAPQAARHGESHRHAENVCGARVSPQQPWPARSASVIDALPSDENDGDAQDDARPSAAGNRRARGLIAPSGLGCVQGGVGGAQEPVGVGRVHRVGGDAR